MFYILFQTTIFLKFKIKIEIHQENQRRKSKKKLFRRIAARLCTLSKYPFV
jgi:hypothetical protein